MSSAGVVVRALAGAGVGVLAVHRSWSASMLDERPLVVALAVMLTAAFAVVVPSVQERSGRPGFVPAAVGLMQFTIYCCVPETDQIPQVAAVVVIAVALELAARRAMPWWFSTALAGLVLWSGLFGATARDSALVGTLFAMWPVVLAVVSADPMVGAVVGGVAAVTVARTGGLQATIGPALLAVAIASVASLVVLGALRTRQRRAR